MSSRAAAREPILERPILLSGAALLCSFSAITTRFDMIAAGGTLPERLIDLGGASTAIWFALFALIVIARRADSASPDRGDWTVAVIAVACSLVPLGQFGGAGLTLLGLWCLIRSRHDPAIRQAGILMLALSTALIWGRIASQLLGPLVLVPDAWAAGMLSGTSSEGNLVGDALILGPGCSSLHNISIAVLIWAAISQIMGLAITRRLLWGLAAAIAVTVAINLTRVVIIVLNMENFDYWHTGTGATIFGFAAFIAALIVTIIVADRETHSRA